MDTAEIFYSPYALRFREGGGNARSQREFLDGALLRIGRGYGCLHPWPELGDPSLKKCLEDLKGPRRSALVRRALRCAELDGIARKLDDWMFEEMEVPESHATLPLCDKAALDSAVEQGFGTVKLKCGRDQAAESVFLREMAMAFPNLRWRLDFNESGSVESVRDFLLGLPEAARGQIDFVEDPCPYEPKGWDELRQGTGVRLAVDREAGPNCPGADVVVIKPAIDEPWLLAEGAQTNGQRVVVTSYMDHPLGQSFAAWEAGRLALQFPGLVDLCGLQTHGLFRGDGFTAALGEGGPPFAACEGTGLGFDELLRELPWRKLG